MSLQASEGFPGLETNVFVPQSPQRDEEGSRSGRSFSEFEDTQDLNTPGLLVSHLSVPWLLGALRYVCVPGTGLRPFKFLPSLS